MIVDEIGDGFRRSLCRQNDGLKVSSSTANKQSVPATKVKIRIDPLVL
jgi:hypothetical protein